MSEPFLGEIKVISWNFPPKGWAFCNGQLLQINQNQALFSILGTTYGGDGRQTFALPNLQGRIPVHVGNGIVLGELGGEQTHTLNISEMPAHTHNINATVNAGDSTDPTTPAIPANAQPNQIYAPSLQSGTAMNPLMIAQVGGSQPHENMSPYLVLNYVIALQGIFPSQT